MALKIYESKLAKHSIPVRVGARTIRVEFKGGITHPHKRGGTYGTSKKAIQEALERNAGFNKKFKCIKTVTTRIEQEAENKKELDDLRSQLPSPPPPPAPPPPVESDITVVDEVTNYQTAKNWLIANYPDLTIPEVKSKVLVREVASEKKVSFPNWPTE